MQRAVLIGLSVMAAAPVQGMQIPPLSTSVPYLTQVAGGCGIGFHRGPYGGCVPNGYGSGGGVVVGAPAYHYGYGYHPGYWHGGYGYHGGYWHGGYHYGYHYGYHGGYHRLYR